MVGFHLGLGAAATGLAIRAYHAQCRRYALLVRQFRIGLAKVMVDRSLRAFLIELELLKVSRTSKIR
jgi:hypothetical protein